MTRLILGIGFTVLMFCLTAAAQTRPAASAKLISVSGNLVAPVTVHVNALDLKLPNGEELTTRYEWNFGDAASRYNTLTGWNAAHTFDRPGRYVIRLSRTLENGQREEFEQVLNVAAFKGRVIYVSAAGDDRNNGASPAKPFRTLQRAILWASNDTKIFLRRGDTFDVSATLQLKHKNLSIGAYDRILPAPLEHSAGRIGAVNPPTIRYIGPRNHAPIFMTMPQARDTLLEDIAFDSIYSRDAEKSRMPAAVRPAGVNLTIRRCVFLNVGDGILNNNRPQGVLMQDCVAPLATGLRSYLAWIEGTDQVYLGNAAVNSTREAVMRISYTGAQRILIARNSLTNLDRSDVDRIDVAKNALTVHSGSHIYITQNSLSSGPIMLGPLGEEDGFGQPNQKLSTVVFEDNLMQRTFLRVNHGIARVTIRNNRFFADDRTAIYVQGFDQSYNRGSSDVRIIHNTAINNGAKGSFLRAGGKIDGVRLINNLYVAPRLRPGDDSAAIVRVGENDLRSFAKVDGNVWPITRPNAFANGGAFYVSAASSDARGYLNLDRWKRLGATGDVQLDVNVDAQLKPRSPRDLPPRTATPGALFDAAGVRRNASAAIPGAMQ